MKIGSHIKPRNRLPRVVTIHGRPYAFAPVLDKTELEHFVAEVKDEKHAEVLLASGDFYHYRDDMAPAATLKRETSAPEAPAGAKTDATVEPNSDDIEQAKNLLLLSVAKMGIALGNTSLPVIRLAIDLEKASDTSRDSALKLLTSALEGAIAAGVKG